MTEARQPKAEARKIRYKLVDFAEFPQVRAAVTERNGSDVDHILTDLETHPGKVARINISSDDEKQINRISAWVNRMGHHRGTPVRVRRKGLYLYVALLGGSR